MSYYYPDTRIAGQKPHCPGNAAKKHKLKLLELSASAAANPAT